MSVNIPVILLHDLRSSSKCIQLTSDLVTSQTYSLCKCKNCFFSRVRVLADASMFIDPNSIYTLTLTVTIKGKISAGIFADTNITNTTHVITETINAFGIDDLMTLTITFYTGASSRVGIYIRDSEDCSKISILDGVFLEKVGDLCPVVNEEVFGVPFFVGLQPGSRRICITRYTTDPATVVATVKTNSCKTPVYLINSNMIPVPGTLYSFSVSGTDDSETTMKVGIFALVDGIITRSKSFFGSDLTLLTIYFYVPSTFPIGSTISLGAYVSRPKCDREFTIYDGAQIITIRGLCTPIVIASNSTVEKDVNYASQLEEIFS